jgi:hypothetical protein
LLDRTPARIAAAAAAALVALLVSAGAGPALADTSPDPTNVSGTLIQGGELAGTAEVEFLVNAGETYTATITVDGRQLVSDAVIRGSAHLYLDTTQLTDGAHAVVVAVGDGHVSDTAWSGTVETLNAPRGGAPAIAGSSEVGATLTASPGSWLPLPNAIAYQWERCGGDGACAAIGGATGESYVATAADAGAQLEVEVTATDANGSTSAVSAPTATVLEAGQAAAVPGAPNGSGACSGAHLAAQIGAGDTDRVALGQGATLRGEVDCAGTPIGGATLDLELAPASGSAPTLQAHVETAADGSFTYAIPSGPSRDITVTYSAYTGASAPAAIATLALLVVPQVTLWITPRKTTNGHAITLAGRVRGGYIEHGGLPLEIEYREGRHWMIYTEVLANATTGRFHWRYTFERTTESITYTFRVVIPPAGVAGYPYAPAASPPRSVHVNP